MADSSIGHDGDSVFWADLTADMEDPAYRVAHESDAARIRETDELVRLVGDFFEDAISAESALAVAQFAQALRDAEAK